MRTLCALSILLIVGAMAAAPIQAENPSEADSIKKVFFVNCPYPPYNIGEEGELAEGGIATELAGEIFRRLGVDIEIRLYPLKRALKMVEHGRADGVTMIIRNAEREDYMAFTDVLFHVREVFYYRSDRLKDFNWTRFEDLKGLRIGLVTSYAYTPEFLDAVKEYDLEVERASSNTLSFQKLYAGRIDLYLCNEALGNLHVSQNPDLKRVIRQAAKPVRSYPDYMAIGKKSPAIVLLAEVNRVIEEMKADGTIDRVLRRTGFPVPNQ